MTENTSWTYHKERFLAIRSPSFILLSDLSPNSDRILNRPFTIVTYDVVLKETSATLNELVVVGYGVQRKSDVTGAISTIKASEIIDQPITRIDQALQGKAAGVQVSTTTGQPGENIKVRIRGIGTINGSDPLYIVDGIPTKDISGIMSPEDIESIDGFKRCLICSYLRIKGR